MGQKTARDTCMALFNQDLLFGTAALACARDTSNHIVCQRCSLSCHWLSLSAPGPVQVGDVTTQTRAGERNRKAWLAC